MNVLNLSSWPRLWIAALCIIDVPSWESYIICALVISWSAVPWFCCLCVKLGILAMCPNGKLEPVVLCIVNSQSQVRWSVTDYLISLNWTGTDLFSEAFQVTVNIQIGLLFSVKEYSLKLNNGEKLCKIIGFQRINLKCFCIYILKWTVPFFFTKFSSIFLKMSMG